MKLWQGGGAVGHEHECEWKSAEVCSEPKYNRETLNRSRIVTVSLCRSDVKGRFVFLGCRGDCQPLIQKIKGKGISLPRF